MGIGGGGSLIVLKRVPRNLGFHTDSTSGGDPAVITFFRYRNEKSDDS